LLNHPLFSLSLSLDADRNAESALNEWLQSNPGELAQALAHEVANDTKSFASRQMAAIYLKNMLMAQSAAVQKEKFDRWKMLDPQARNVVKECLLRALRHPTGANAAATNGQTLPEHSLPHFCAVAIAEIAVVELPHNEWPTLVPSVMENVSTTSTSEYVKIASLECLGYTCERYADVEDMFGDAWPVLHETTVNDMLTTIVDGVQPTRPESIRHAAITALKNSLLFVRSNMEKPLERKFIINAITQACTSPDPRVRATAYACLDTVAEQYYECLPDHMTEIYNLSTECINRGEAEEESVKMAAIEFWTQLATVEQRLLDEEREATEVGMALPRLPCPKYVEAAMTNLVPLLLNTLTHQDEDSEGGEFNWDLQASGAVCLETISQTVEGAILAHVIPFVTQHIQSADWRYRDAAIVAFSSILDGPSTEQVADYVTQSIQVLLQSFQDQKAIVRWSAVRCIGKICQLHMTAVSPSATHAILDQLLQQLKDARTKIAAASCSAIFDMAEAFKPMGEAIPDSNLLSAPMLPLMQNLMTASDREDSGEDNLRVAAMSAAAVLITASALDVEPIFAELLPNIIGRTEVALKRQVFSNDDREAKEQVLGLLCGLLHGLYMRMPKEAVMQHTDKVVQLLLQVFQLQDASCHEEGFMVIGAIANKVEEDFVVRRLSDCCIFGMR
jgi:importin subunit beta-1